MKTLSSPTAPIVSGGMVKVVVPVFGPSSCARKLCEGDGEGAAGPPVVSPCAAGAVLETDGGRFGARAGTAGESGMVSGAGIANRGAGPLLACASADGLASCLKLTCVAETGEMLTAAGEVSAPPLCDDGAGFVCVV